MVDSITGKPRSSPLPKSSDTDELAGRINSFFVSKIAALRQSLDAADDLRDPLADDVPFLASHHSDELLSAFEEVPAELVKRIVLSSPSATCSLDPIPTPLLKKVINVLLPALTRIVNQPLSSGIFPSAFHLLLANDNDESSILLLLDLSAAFDTVDHTILLKRLSQTFGFSDSALGWFGSYISGRAQSVIKGVSSYATALKYGVSQGSVLGPNVFVVYVYPLSGIAKKWGLVIHQ